MLTPFVLALMMANTMAASFLTASQILDFEAIRHGQSFQFNQSNEPENPVDPTDHLIENEIREAA